MSTNDNATKRNAWLDLIKLIASFMVVFIHIDFPGKFGYVMDAIARFAVPLFFAVSGFFALNTDTATIKRRAIKIGIIYLISATIYHIYDIICVGFINHIIRTFTLGNAFYLVFFNVPLVSVHLWFLLALICVYLIWLLVIKLNLKDKTIFILSVVCLAIHLFFGEILTIFNIRIPATLVRNFAFMGFPFFTLGYLANKHKEKLLKTNNAILIVLLVVGCLESALSCVFFDYNEIYIGSICILCALIVISIKLQEKPLDKFWILLSSTSSDIYIFHILISSVVMKCLNLLNTPTNSLIFGYVWPLIVCLVCMMLSLIKKAIIKKP